VLHNGLEAVVERGDVLFFVVERDYDRIFRHGYDDTPLTGFAVEI
jgi:hypothetical protein